MPGPTPVGPIGYLYKDQSATWSKGLGGSVVKGASNFKIVLTNARIGSVLHIYMFYVSYDSVATITGSGFSDLVSDVKFNDSSANCWWFTTAVATSTEVELNLTAPNSIGNQTYRVLVFQ